MSELQDIRRRIKSITHTAQITRAMQNIARSRITFALKSLRDSDPYASELDQLIRTTYRKTDTPIPNSNNKSKTHLVVLMTPDRGLCGTLNQNIFKLIDTLSPKNTRYVTLGRKGARYLAQCKHKSLASFHLELKPSYADCRKPAEFCLQYLTQHQASHLSILFPNFVNPMIQNAKLKEIFPFCDQTTATETDTSTDGSRIYEPSIPTLIKTLIPTHVNTQIYQAILSTRASEFFARMVAMKQATDSAEDLIASLTHTYHKIRQETITSGILEASEARLH